MKLQKSALAVVLALGVSAAAHADGVTDYLKDLNYFAGAGIGATAYNDVSYGGGSSTDQSFQYRVFGGAWGRGVSFVSHFGAEIGYTNLGSYKNSTGGVSYEVKNKAEYIDALAAHDFGDQWRVYGKLGLYHANTDVSLSGPVFLAGSHGSSNIGVHIGIGGEYNVLPNLAVLAVAEYFDSVGDNSAISTPVNLDVITIGAAYRF